MMKSIFGSALLLSTVLFFIGIRDVMSESKAPPTHDDCITDNECVPITSIKQSCRHVDPQAEYICPAINSKYAKEIGAIDCARTVGCRSAVQVACINGKCVAK